MMLGLSESGSKKVLTSRGGANAPLARATSAVSSLVMLGFIAAFAVIVPERASAIPSFARQTGQPCAACHTAFPELTPFGRRFKLGGYVLGGGDSKIPPVAAMILPTFTHTNAAQDTPPAPGTQTNNNIVLQQASLFYGGQIYGNLGAFMQATYDRASGQFFLDNTDIRYTDTFKLFGQDTIIGVTVNNTPTVQDVWNTTTAWGYPEVGATLAPQFAPPGTMLEGNFAGKVIGAGVYAFWNDMLYLELSGYQTMSPKLLTTLGEPDAATSDGIRGIAPYWRLAIEPTWGEHSFMIGTFGMAADIYPGRQMTFGVNHLTDIGVDAQYQYNGDMNSLTIKATNIFEQQQLGSSFLQMNSSNSTNSLRSFKLSASWVYDHTYSASAGFFDVAGSADMNLYGVANGGNSLTNSPNGQGLVFDLAFLPFSHGGPSFWPWANARIGVSYTHYLKLYGGVANFDGAGHNASDNNTTFVYAWIAF